jgi:hypothetical protein
MLLVSGLVSSQSHPKKFRFDNGEQGLNFAGGILAKGVRFAVVLQSGERRVGCSIKPGTGRVSSGVNDQVFETTARESVLNERSFGTLNTLS